LQQGIRNVQECRRNGSGIVLRALFVEQSFQFRLQTALIVRSERPKSDHREFSFPIAATAARSAWAFGGRDISGVFVSSFELPIGWIN
jgi:hypothetical protein